MSLQDIYTFFTELLGLVYLFYKHFIGSDPNVHIWKILSSRASEISLNIAMDKAPFLMMQTWFPKMKRLVASAFAYTLLCRILGASNNKIFLWYHCRQAIASQSYLPAFADIHLRYSTSCYVIHHELIDPCFSSPLKN